MPASALTPNLTFESFAKLAKTYNLIPLYGEIPADLDTPVSAFLKLRSNEYDFLFESVVGGEKWARYSFLGADPRQIYFLSRDILQLYDRESGEFTDIVYTGNPLLAFRELMTGLKPYQDKGLPRFFGGLVGYLSYAMVRYFENVRMTGKKPYDAPELAFFRADTVVIFDSLAQVMKIVCAVEIPDTTALDSNVLRQLYDKALAAIRGWREKLLKPVVPPRTAAVALHQPVVAPAGILSRERYCALVKRAKEYIEAGDVFQVVLSNRFELDATGIDPFNVYRNLRRINPSPYMFYLKLRDVTIVGASPEILVRLEDGNVVVRPIAGTRKRGVTEDEDAVLMRELLADPKELAEHVMLVDLGRNDVGRVASTGTVRVDEQHVVEKYSHVMHLVSHVSGQIAAGKDAFDVIAAAFPAGTLTGAPKIRAMEIIEELEESARAVYGGAVGYVSFTGNTDLAIAIRTAVFCDGKAFVQAGAGIVYNSVPEKEYEECVNKAKGMIAAIQ